MDSTQDYGTQRPETPEAGVPAAGMAEPPPVAPQSPAPAPVGRSAQSQKWLYKSSSLAAFLSLMPGLGQVYVGYYQRGFVNLAVVASVITALSVSLIPGLEPLFGIFLGFFWLYNIIDAYRRASLYNQALDGLGGVELPEDFQLPDRGSVAGGVVLIVIGLLLFMHTKFDMSMAWLQEWWPLVAVGLGVYLVYKAKMGKE